MTTTEQQLELRCPLGPRQLLAKVAKNGDYRGMDADGLTLNIACRDCAKVARRSNPQIKRAIHKFNILGEIVETDFQTSY